MKNLFMLLAVFILTTSCTEKINTKDSQQSEISQVMDITKFKENETTPIDSLYNSLSTDLEIFLSSVGEHGNYLKSYGFDPTGKQKEYVFLVKNKDTISISHWMGYYPKNRVGQKVVTSILYPYFEKKYILEVKVVDKSHTDNNKTIITQESINNIDAMKIVQEFFYEKIGQAEKYKLDESQRVLNLLKKN